MFPLLGNAQVQLIYFTDAHQLYELDDVAGGRGGVARLKTIVDLAKKENNQTITIHGGDFVGGVLYGGIYKGEHMLPVFNQIPVDLFNFGQHEFDYGVDHLTKLMQSTNGQFFTSNLINENGQPLNDLPSYIIKKIKNQTLLFIGLTDQMETTKKDARVQQADIFSSVEKVLKSVDLTSIDQIIAVTQMDLEKNKQLIHQFPQINLVLTEELEEYHTQIHYQNNVPIIATAGNMSSVAKVNLSQNKNPIIEIIALDSKVNYDRKLREMELKVKARVDAILQENLAELRVDLDAFESLKKESLAGNLITDAMRNHYKTDLAIIDGSGIRKSVSKGDFTLEKVRTLLPFGNKIVVVKLLGKDFKKFIHSYLSNTKPKLIQISGTTYQWNPVTKELIFDHIKDDVLYSLCLNDYNFGKLSTYDEVLIDSNHIDSLEDYIVLKQYIQQLKIINPTIENRITITHE